MQAIRSARLLIPPKNYVICACHNLILVRFKGEDCNFTKTNNSFHKPRKYSFLLENNRQFSSDTSNHMQVDVNLFEKACEETLESLSEYFEEIVERSSELAAADVSYSGGVLTVNLGKKYGIYVINKQSPNRQIWLSSPISGPKRYDFIQNQNCWIYKHDGMTLHHLLQTELSKTLKTDLNFSNCLFGKIAQKNE